jgi:hypothetical protein
VALSLLDRLLGTGEPTNGHHLTELAQENYALGSEQEILHERIADLELALEDLNWTRLGFESNQEFSRQGMKRIIAYSRIFFLKNPLINRAVTLQAQYVWGQGVSVSATHPDVDDVVQQFLGDPQNERELTGHQARIMKEQDLQVDGNLFFALFTNKLTGRTRVRTINVEEIDDVIRNPDDYKEPWYYKRVWTPRAVSIETGIVGASGARTEYYPDWRYAPQGRRPETIGGHKVRWDAPVYHVRVGGLSHMAFGIPETYQALDWARAYKDFLEDWATIVRAYSKFAWNLNTAGGKRGQAAAKTRLGTTVGVGGGSGMADTNPPGPAGATFVHTEGTSLDPIKTAGATTSADDGRRLLLMVAASTGLPESFFGDVSVGTLATAKSLDRPTELKFRDRQTLWQDILSSMLQYVVDQTALAPKGKIKGSRQWNEEHDEQIIVLANDPDTGEELDRHIDIDFPPILEPDRAGDIGAIVDAATLGGHVAAGTIDAKTVTRLLLTALGQDDIAELLEQIFPEGEEPDEGGEETAAEPAASSNGNGGPPTDTTGAEQPTLAVSTTESDRALTESLRDLRRAIVAFANRTE